MDLLSICNFIAIKNTKCISYIEKIYDQKNLLLSFNLKNLLVIIIFFIFFFLIFRKIKNINNYILIFISFNLTFFLSLLTIYPSNIPFTDTWLEINDLINNDLFTYLLMKNGSHPFLGFKFFHLINYKFFSLNYVFIHFINFTIFFISFLYLFFYIKKFENTSLILIFLFIFFSGKWANIILEPVNLVWTINFALSIFFVLSLNLQEGLYKYSIIFLILCLSALNFGAGIVLLLYSLIYYFFIFNKKKYLIQLFYIISPIVIYFFVYEFLDFYLKQNKSTTNLSFLLERDLFLILKDYFSLSSFIFFPYINFSKNITIFLGFFQNCIILFYIFLFKKDYYETIKKIILNNSILVIGIIGCLLVVTIRGSVSEQIRYSSFSILFQIGFFIFMYQNFPKIFLFFKKKIFIYIFFISYLISILGPNTGMHFGISRAAIYNEVNFCLNHNKKECNKIIYDLTFYNGDWYRYDDFLKIINYLYLNKLSFYNNLNE